MSDCCEGPSGGPSAKECDSLCNQFVEVTGCNTAEAIMHLQRQAWVLQKAIHAYFEKSNPVAKLDHSSKVDSQKVLKSKAGIEPEDSNKIRVLSWNLDGLDDVSLITRTRAASAEILKQNPDVIFLQEVVSTSWNIIKEKMAASYELYPADSAGYYTVMLMKKDTVWIDSKEIKPFYSSVMSRKLQIVNANIKGIDFKLMTSHLESTREHAKERRRQLEICINEMNKTESDTNVLFGGDLNLGVNDLKDFHIPASITDIWEATGSRKEACYTWDLTRNDNKQIPGAKPRCRFDRLFLRNATTNNVRPKYFELVGIQRVPECSRFPSDHWGILAHLEII